MSKANQAEARAVAFLVELVAKHVEPSQIGVITPYQGQVKAVQHSLGRRLDLTALVTVSSVDAFQGSEREVIVLSMVRSNTQGDLGFVADWRRLNVALTRAKR